MTNNVRRSITSGSAFETAVGYARAVVDGDWIFVSGTTGFDSTNMAIADDAAAQAETCIANIVAVLAEADAVLADVVRVHYLVPSREDFRECIPVLRAHFGPVAPAATMFIAQLFDPRMKIEIEVTARKRS